MGSLLEKLGLKLTTAMTTAEGANTRRPPPSRTRARSHPR
jgi:hypothetical protein